MQLHKDTEKLHPQQDTDSLAQCHTVLVVRTNVEVVLQLEHVTCTTANPAHKATLLFPIKQWLMRKHVGYPAVESSCVPRLVFLQLFEPIRTCDKVAAGI